MLITKIGTDYVYIDENTLFDEKIKNIPRIHIIKLDFHKPEEYKIKEVLKRFPLTNRFVVNNNIKIYNSILKNTNKKYYVENTKKDNIITFFRRNNKILLNFIILDETEQNFFLNDRIFDDILKNTEIIHINKRMFDEKMRVLDFWRGNVIISEE